MARFDSFPFPPIYIKLLNEGRVKPGKMTRRTIEEWDALLERCHAAARRAAPKGRRASPGQLSLPFD